MKSKLLLWELIGAIFIIAMGSVLHFTYEWTQGNSLSFIFGAVNESTWEHMKIAFWAGIIFLVVEFLFLYPKVNNFWTAKAASLLLPVILIPLLFYTYIELLGFDSMVINIIIFVLSILIGKLAAYKILIMESLPKVTSIISSILLVLMVLAFLTFTKYPPNNNLFIDPR